MQVFKAFLRIVKTRIISVCIYFGIFIGIAIAISNIGQENDAKKFSSVKLTIAVENLDQGELGAGLVKYLDEKNNIADFPDTDEKVLDQIFSREIDYVLYIPKDFTSRFMAGDREDLLKDRKVPSSSNGTFADNQIESYLTTVGMYADSGFSLKESLENADKDMQTESTVEFSSSSGENKIEPGQYYFQYLPYIFICTLVSAVGPVFMAFNEKDISARNKCSSMTFLNRNLQLIAGSVVISLLDWGILVAVAAIMYPAYVLSLRGVLSMVNSLLEVVFGIAMAYTAAQFVKKEEALSMVSNLFGLGLAFLGGLFVPMEIFGDNVLKVSRFLPTYWYVIANDAIKDTTGISSLSTDITHAYVIQGIYCIAVLLIGMLMSRMKVRE